MSVRFILGRAGSGKTWTCLDSIRRAAAEDPLGPPILFLVPEQASFQMERDLVAGQSHANGSGPRAIIRAQVLSFRRLAWRIFDEVGGPVHPPLSELGKQMALRSLLQKRGEELVFFRGATLTPGFTARLASTLSELKTYGVTPDTLEEWLAGQEGAGAGAGGKVEAPALAKAHDLLLLFRDYEAYLAERFTDPDDYLDLLTQRLAQSTLLRQATVWIDGFAGFTPQEVKVLRALFRTVPKVHVALCLDPSELGLDLAEVDLFAPTRETYDLLRRVAAQEGVAMEPPLELGRGTSLPRPASSLPRFTHGVLDHIESQWPRLAPTPYAVAKQGKEAAPPGKAVTEDGTTDLPVTVVAAANRRAEAEWVAREIVRLCRDCGYRYREISVVLRTLDRYDSLIAGAFEECKIPFFIDRRRPVPHHPVIEVVRSAVEAAGGGWAAEPVLRLLKTDLFPATRDQIDLLENYVLAHGVRGERWWAGAWDFASPARATGLTGSEAADEADEAVSRTRLAVVGPLRQLAERFAGRWTARRPLPTREATAALRGLLDDLEVAAQLERWAAEETAAGHPLAAQEHLQVWSGITGLLNQLDESLGDQAVTPDEYLQILESGLAGLKLGLIPPGLDQVMVGSIERSRQPEIKACFVMGATDGVFPSSRGEDIVFSDRERDQLAQAGLNLAPTGRRQTLREQYFVYIAVTRASGRLYVTHPLADQEGRALAPSPALVGRLRSILPMIKEVAAGVEPTAAAADGDQMAYLARPEQAVRHLARHLRMVHGGSLPGPVWWGVYRWVREDPDRRRAALAVLRSLVHRNDVPRLPPELVRRLHGLRLRSSVSRLEDFADCPFRYFAAHGLRLAERPEQQFKAPDMGSFFHAALQVFVKDLTDRHLDWATLGPEETQGLVGQAVDKVAPTIQSQVLLGSARRRHLTMVLRRTLTRSVTMLGEHARRSRFRPAAVELAFGMPGVAGSGDEGLPALEIKVGEGSLTLRGIIDRVDAAPGDDGWYLRIVDYKSSRKALKFQRIREGLALQLLVYALVALESADRLRPGSGPAPAPAGAVGEPAAGPATTAAMPAAAPPASQVNLAALQYFTIADPMISAAGPLATAKVDAMRAKGLKMTGLVLADQGSLELLDTTLVANTRSSDLFTKTAVSREELAAVLAFARKKVAELAQRIFEGEAAIRPWRQGNESACTWCPYKPVCSFDLLVPGCAYRDLPPVNSKADLAAIVAEARGGRGGASGGTVTGGTEHAGGTGRTEGGEPADGR